ncbi:hypothetical protein [Actinopolymorpha pittospori]|uniref:Uncharacterized protein n=1 Tax=Actinopolymorpha pittospori TaxID=648752 RepID=A0A927RB28_9ACTN|nr:hypothetical protein [Actinopolymorpha pittospori]MBE1605670.1 hypothetical protein [Actinopolymorpha pittospori]
MSVEASVAVTDNTTADTPDSGTPAAPVMWKVRDADSPNGAFAVPRPLRVSTILVGGSGTYSPPAASVPEDADGAPA